MKTENLAGFLPAGEQNQKNREGGEACEGGAGEEDENFGKGQFLKPFCEIGTS